MSVESVPTEVWVWLCAIGLLVAIQMMVDTLDPLFLGAGALAACALVLMVPGAPVWSQILLASGVAIAGVASTRQSVLRRLQGGPGRATNVDRLVGLRAVVSERIDNDAQVGQIVLLGERWSARASAEGGVIESDTAVRIDSIDGVTAMVAPMSERG